MNHQQMKDSIVWIPSMSKPGHKHKVDLVLNECDCEGFEFRRDCSHLRDAIAEAQLEAQLTGMGYT